MSNNQEISSCCFCEPLDHLIIKDFEHFRILIDPYPLCIGHLLIVAKEHYGCSGELPNEHLKELENIRQPLCGAFEDLFSSCLLYEHGRSGTCMNAPEAISCYHMHLHVLSVRCNIHHELSTLFDSHPILAISDLQRWFHSYGEYLYFQNNEGNGKCYLTHNKSVEPHLLRTLIAKKIQMPHLQNWESYDDKNTARGNIALKEKIGSFFSKLYV